MSENRIISREIRQIAVGEVITYTADFTAILNGETLSSVDTVTQTGGSGLTLGSGSVNGSTVESDGGTIAVGKAIQFLVTCTGSASTGAAVVKVIGVLSGSPTQKKRIDCQFEVME